METPNYKESTINGTQYQRAVRVVVENPRGQAPSLLYVEETVTLIGEGAISNLCANISVPFNPENPLHLQAYTVLNAIYEEERAKRDAPQELST